MAQQGFTRAVVLDEAIVFQQCDENAADSLRPGADKLLIRLSRSGLFVGLFFRSDISARKALREIGVSKGLHLIQTFSDQSQVLSEAQCVVVCAEKNLEEFKASLDSSWNFIAAEDSTLQLESLPFAITSLIKKELGNKITLVGHCMNWKREKDLLQRGALPFMSTFGMSFTPLDLSSSLDRQLSVVDIVLNKATDEIVSVSKVVSDTNEKWINFSDRFNKLERYLQEHPDIHVVDPTDRVTPLMDRVATQSLLEELPLIEVAAGGPIVRPPRCVKVTGFDDAALFDKLKSANLVVPTIVKPQIACGASESHTMAIVFEDRGYSNLAVPLPAVIQEYVDHQSVIFKFYVLGEQVFYSTRKSTPDAVVLRTMINTEAPSIVFDSLKTLPTGRAVDEKAAESALDITAMRSTAAVLRRKLGLTIIGFDVVVHSHTRDHVIVDVNYFPTFKDVPDTEAVPAFWKALQESRNTRTI
ncbi:inositol 1,3,4-trisphosphate 5/6-kinase 4 isoform X2 [Selaginella moellendorffii]|uniref:inositol 1,3,4-trisphosphate 5/6-kinase 4 isoform X2 n=1 Tax=Selaginella moellendorffii TaxID=88036 RepID=UPI000D1C7BA8|nr:inositol 1,3,4-trisphosphate 5/6-kinase 4 isoform X2 [Selaginella moellendorffii]|eukprot:XP_024544573.1 inositol 1,3,4-trisphosphate 5/6-kinase 4 isoform X2 [Selaginella moellendorffii]